ncbi:LOW QUALITY PROTEIN: hypothetical protein TorRG33x02_070420 [Trema orientale]|uniref:Uncharacterized protein n=1 Tax=Trema orientale TaxID=63057 RepID=A0A2P5FHP1_TREOI|nr:LOW QUALITY PROTEIN: hypothetical protein TorRG33x02_070420 [Trema orientale]
MAVRCEPGLELTQLSTRFPVDHTNNPEPRSLIQAPQTSTLYYEQALTQLGTLTLSQTGDQCKSFFVKTSTLRTLHTAASTLTLTQHGRGGSHFNCLSSFSPFPYKIGSL